MHDDGINALTKRGIWIQGNAAPHGGPVPRYYIPETVASLSLSYSAAISPQGAETGRTISVRENVVEVLTKAPAGITLAQRSNFAPPTAWVYEDLWRKKSIGILSGEPFSFEDERNLLLDWLRPAPGELLLDIGCSSGFYARSLQQAEPGSRVVAIDFSSSMLKDARKRAKADGCAIYLLRADAQALPFAAQSADALCCGGSLNEFAQPERALKEARRVLKPGGRFFMMHLLKARTTGGRLLQKAAGGGGIHFWTEEESRHLFKETGFRIAREKQVGIVMFSLLEPA